MIPFTSINQYLFCLQLSRDYNLQCVYLYYPVLKQHIQYDFEPCDNDTVEKVTAEHSSAEQTLRKEAKRWACRIARENNNTREYVRKLQVFQALRESGQKVMLILFQILQRKCSKYIQTLARDILTHIHMFMTVCVKYKQKYMFGIIVFKLL